MNEPSNSPFFSCTMDPSINASYVFTCFYNFGSIIMFRIAMYDPPSSLRDAGIRLFIMLYDIVRVTSLGRFRVRFFTRILGIEN